MPGIRTPTCLWRDTVQSLTVGMGPLIENAGGDLVDAGLIGWFCLMICCPCHILLKYGLTVTELHAFVMCFMPIQHLCFCVYLDLLVQSSDSAWRNAAVEKPWAVQLIIHGLSDWIAFKIFSVDTVNPCFNSPLLKTVAVIVRNDTCDQQNQLAGALHNHSVSWSPQQSPDQ